VRAYGWDWRDFLNFCDARGLQALPASPEVVALYITHRANSRRAITVQRRLAAISQTHQDAGHPTPADDRLVRKTMAGIRRTQGTAPRTKTAARTKFLRHLGARHADTTEGLRDRALLPVGFAGAFRRSELVALDRTDITFGSDGARVMIRTSKTDQESASAVVGLPNSPTPARCARRAPGWPYYPISAQPSSGRRPYCRLHLRRRGELDDAERVLLTERSRVDLRGLLSRR